MARGGAPAHHHQAVTHRGFRVKDLLVVLVVLGGLASIYNARSEAQSQIAASSQLREEWSRQKHEFELKAGSLDTTHRAELTQAEEKQASLQRQLEAVKADRRADGAARQKGDSELSSRVEEALTRLSEAETELTSERSERANIERDLNTNLDESVAARDAERAGHDQKMSELRQAAVQQVGLCRADLATFKEKSAHLEVKGAEVDASDAARDAAMRERDAVLAEADDLRRQLAAAQAALLEKSDVMSAAKDLADLAHVVADKHQARGDHPLPRAHAAPQRRVTDDDDNIDDPEVVEAAAAAAAAAERAADAAAAVALIRANTHSSEKRRSPEPVLQSAMLRLEAELASSMSVEQEPSAPEDGDAATVAQAAAIAAADDDDDDDDDADDETKTKKAPVEADDEAGQPSMAAREELHDLLNQHEAPPGDDEADLDAELQAGSSSMDDEHPPPLN